MKNSIIILAISSISLGGLLLTPSQPSSKADAKEDITSLNYNSNYNEDSLQHILDSISKYKTEEVNKYVTEIKKSTQIITKTEKKLSEMEMHVDLLLSKVDTLVIDTAILDTVKPIKKQTWFKKQINKLKNK